MKASSSLQVHCPFAHTEACPVEHYGCALSLREVTNGEGLTVAVAQRSQHHISTSRDGSAASACAFYHRQRTRWTNSFWKFRVRFTCNRSGTCCTISDIRMRV